MPLLDVSIYDYKTILSPDVTICETFTLRSTFDTIRGMAKVGQALKQVLEAHNITQNRLAVVMGTRRSNVGRWFHEHIDPTGDTIIDIAKALHTINPVAADEFIRLYLGEYILDPGEKSNLE